MGKMKRLSALLLAVLLTLSNLPVTTLATDGDVIDGEIGTEDSIFGLIGSGTCGDGLTWSFYEDGLLYIKGSGAMDDYSADDPAPWDYCKHGITDLRIDEGVTHIGDYAFADCTELMWLDLPEDTLTSIGDHAFESCESLQEIKLPETLTELGTDAFAWCTGVTGTLVIPGAVGSVPQSAFAGLCGITDLVIGSGVTNIYTPADILSAFFSMEAVETVTFEGLLVPVMGDPFYYMTNLKTVYVPAAAYPLYARSYESTLPNGAEMVPVADENNIFMDGECGDDLTWTLDGDGLLTISGSGEMDDYTADSLAPWMAYKDFITEIAFDPDITHIGDYAFYGCQRLSTLALPESLTEIGCYAFAWCTGLTGELVIPDRVERIYEGAFSGLHSVTSLVLGEGVIYLYAPADTGNAFNAMESVTEVTFKGLPPALLMEPFFSMYALETVYVPAEYYDRYVTAFAGVLPEGVELVAIDGETGGGSGGEGSGDDVIVYPPEFQVEDGVLIAYTGSDTEVTVPYGITEIGDLVFYCNRKITKINLPSTVERIGHDAFASCYSLMEINLPEGLTEIDHHAFSSCNSLSGITLPKSLQTIGEYAFYGCFNMTGELVVPDGVTSIGQSAFNGCSKITGVTLPKGLTAIADYTFNGCTALLDAVIPDSVTSIGYMAFANCKALTAIDLPESLTTLGNYAFQNCTAATGEVVIPDSVTDIPMGAFAYTGKVEKLTVGAGVELIYSAQNNAHAFYDMNSVTEVTFTGLTVPNDAPDGYESNKALFTYMPALETVYVPAAAYANYEAAYADYLPEGVELVAVGAAQPDVKPMQGTCGDGLTWVLDETGVLTISGSGDMWDFSYGDEPLWMEHADRITGLVLGEGITSIGNQAFQALSGLKNVHIPASVADIGEYAFFNCGNLTELYFYNDETPPTIGDSAFRQTGLGTVYVPPTRYTLYKSTIREALPAGVSFAGLPEVVVPETNPLECVITASGATVSGEDLQHYVSKNALLLMAAYDADGRFLGASETVSQVVGGTCSMTIEAEEIARVQLFVMDWDNAPMKEAYCFE